MVEERLSFDVDDLDRENLIDELSATIEGIELARRPNRERSSDEKGKLLATLSDLKLEKAAFGLRPEVLPLRAEALGARGIILDSRIKALLEQFDFYVVTFPVTLFPKRGWAFDRLECQVEFNPGESPDRRPLAHDIFPSSAWETLARASMKLEIGVDTSLAFRMAASASLIGVTDLEGSFASSTSFVFPPRDYCVKRPRILSRGKDDCEVFWRLDNESYFEEDEPRLGVILKVPHNVLPVKAQGVLAAYRSFKKLSADLGDLMSYLSDRMRNFFQRGAPLVDRREWDL